MKQHIWLWIALFGLAALVVIVGVAYISYSADLRSLSDRLSSESRVTETSHGAVQFTEWGTGPPVLVIHGAGGGYDQGILIAEAFGGEGFRWIVPSRFGYLGTPLPADTSTTAQADAFADLLDTLGIDRVAILAMSGGVPPSLQFAARYPTRTSALVLLSSAPYTPLTAEAQTPPVPNWVYQMLFGSDFPYWVLQRVARAQLETIFDVSPATRSTLTPEGEAFVSAMVDAFQPVTQRQEGLANEGAAIDPNADYRLEAITTPTLVVHAEDDGINPFAYGQYTADNIQGAVFMPVASGGHLLLGHHADVRSRVTAFLRRYGGS